MPQRVGAPVKAVEMANRHLRAFVPGIVRGIALALSELVEEGWLKLDDALDLVDPIMHGNARRIFRVADKTEALRHAAWAG